MTKKHENIVKILGALSPLFVSCVLLAVQWGNVTTKLEIFDTRLNKMEKTDEKLTDTMVKISNDVAKIKGIMENISK